MSAKVFAWAALASVLMTSSLFAADDHTSASVTVSNPKHCKVVERKSGDHPSAGLSTSVTAGNGHVSAQTSGGNGVTIQSGNGSTSSTVATTGSGGHATTVTSADGNCTLYVEPGTKVKED